MSPAPSVPLVYAACLALEVQPLVWPDGRLELRGPTGALQRLTALVGAQRVAFIACVVAESVAAHGRQRDGFRAVRVYDVDAEHWHDVPRLDPRVSRHDCRLDPQRRDILAALDRALCVPDGAAVAA